MVLAAIPDRPNSQVQMRIVSWLMTIATPETREYRMNRGMAPSPRDGESTRFTIGIRSTPETRR
jgi:hypothetical protein